MLKFNELKQKRAITLVALIITIIVMLILVGVSISVLINSDLIGTAQNAGERTETAYGEEGSMGQITVGNKTYASIEDYIAGEEMKKWVTIYEGEATTTDGQVLLSEDILFNEFPMYKITVASTEFTGTVITRPILGNVSDGMEMYVLFVVSEGKVITFNSAEEFMAYENGGTMIVGINTQESGSSLMVGDSETGEPTCDYTIEKIEVEIHDTVIEPKGTKIYEGELTVTGSASNPITIEEFHKYGMIVECMKSKFWVELSPDALIAMATPVGQFTLFKKDILCCMIEEQISAISVSNMSEGVTILIKAIYDMGEVENFTEDEFQIYFNENASQWYLINSPSGSYEIPATVGDAPVQCVVIDGIGGIPTFTFPVNLVMAHDGLRISECKVTVNDTEFIKKLLDVSLGYELKIDLSSIGDNLELTEDILEILNGNSAKVLIVTQAVKDKYPDYENIIVE